MDDKNENSLQESNGLESLEDAATVVEPTNEPTPSTGEPSPAPAPAQPPQAPKTPRFGGFKKRFPSINIYLLIFVLVLLLAGGIGGYAYISSRKDATTVPIKTQTLDAKALAQLANTSTTVGSTDQVLNVQSSAIFAGKVLVRDTLEVAGGLQIGGSLSIEGVTVSGSSTFGQVQINKNIAVLGDSTLQGSLTVQKSLSVNGGGTFNGPVSATQITTNALQMNGDLVLNHHITAGGPTPSRSNGNALGSGGTSSVSGSDTSGAISINTGSGPSAGCFITVNFTSKFNATPHVLLTPVGSSAGGLSYYVNRTTTNFSVCAASTPPANANFGFDYFVLD